ANLIDAQHAGAAVLDAFAGMCAIGTQLAPQHRVLANDVHAFASTVARALLTAPARRPSRESAAAELMPWFDLNANRLTALVERRLTRERKALVRAEDHVHWRELK